MKSTQPEEIILIPPTHEQTAATFQMVESLKESFLLFLESEDIGVWREPAPLDKAGPDAEMLVQVEVDPKVPLAKLESVLHDFLERIR